MYCKLFYKTKITISLFTKNVIKLSFQFKKKLEIINKINSY